MKCVAVIPSGSLCHSEVALCHSERSRGISEISPCASLSRNDVPALATTSSFVATTSPCGYSSSLFSLPPRRVATPLLPGGGELLDTTPSVFFRVFRAFRGQKNISVSRASVASVGHARFLHALRLVGMTVCAIFFLAACDSATPFDEEPMSTAVRSYLTVTIGTGGAAQTRNPNGGEEGDGLEAGTADENKVEDVTLLFFSLDQLDELGQSATGVNAANPEDVPITCALYFSNPVQEDNDTFTKTVPLPDALSTDKTYHLLAIVNAGNMVPYFSGKTLKDVQGYIYRGAVQTDGKRFVMVSADDNATLSFSDNKGNGTLDNPYLAGDITVERLAARIDIVPGSGAVYSEEDHTYTYKLHNDKTTFVLQSITPVNCLKESSGSYLLKRVADSMDSPTPTYLGDETATEGAATNYVLSPHRNDFSSTLFFDFDRTEIMQATETSSEGDYYTLAYVLENTRAAGAPDADCTTGVEIEGYYLYESGQKVEVKQTYYIRHSDPDGTADDNAVMKYGIVRNNIYRLTIMPTKEGIDLTLSVRNWRVVTHKEIVM